MLGGLGVPLIYFILLKTLTLTPSTQGIISCVKDLSFDATGKHVTEQRKNPQNRVGNQQQSISKKYEDHFIRERPSESACFRGVNVKHITLNK